MQVVEDDGIRTETNRRRPGTIAKVKGTIVKAKGTTITVKVVNQRENPKAKVNLKARAKERVELAMAAPVILAAVFFMLQRTKDNRDHLGRK